MIAADPKLSDIAPPQPISAIVPARDEELTIEPCIRSLAHQPEITQIIVIDDQSTDRTAQIVRALIPQIPHLQLLDAPSVPTGWLGKNHALWHGAAHATSQWLLFIDSDAELLDGATARALRIAGENNSALVSFSPEQLMGAWYEKALIPFVYYRLAKYFPYGEVNNPASKAAAANGQFLMIRRDVYDEVGGHRSVASDVLEDVALATRVKVSGRRIWFGPGAGAVRARMYRSFDAMWQGWEKNLYVLIGGTPGAFYREMLTAFPWISLLLLIFGLKVPIAFVAGAGLLLARHAVYSSTLLRNQFRGIFILYYVPATALYAAVLWASYRAYAHGVVRWKGRQVAVKPVG
jgi:glycosyltransferase involved in cell wall biosynthesis